MKKITIIFCGLLLTLSWLNSPIWGQKPTEVSPGAIVYIMNGPQFVDNTATLTICTAGTDSLKIINKTTSHETIENYQWVGNRFENREIVDKDSSIYVFSCPKNNGEWRFRIIDHLTVILTVQVNCSNDSLYVSAPSLPRSGMIILIALILVTGGYLLVSRKTLLA